MAIRPIDDANVVTPRGSIVGPDFNTYVSGGVFSGPLIKPQYTNFMLWSEDLTNSAWTKSGFNSTSQQTGITGQQFTEATQLTTTTTSGLVLQSMPSSAMITGGCYQMTAWMRLISGNSNVQFGVGGQYIQKTSGVVLTSSWQQVNIYTLVGRDATQTVGDPRASGDIYGAYFYIPSGTVVQISGVQMTLGNFVEPYVKTTSLYGRVAPRYETGCIYVSRRERNYLQESNMYNVTSYWLNALIPAAGGITNDISSPDTPIGQKNISRMRNDSTAASIRGVVKNMPIGPGQDLSKPFQIIKTLRGKHINGIASDYFSSNTFNGVSFGIDSIDGLIGTANCTGQIKSLGDGWQQTVVIPLENSGPMNVASGPGFNIGPRIAIRKDSSPNYGNSFANTPDNMYLANFQILDTYHTPSFFVTGASSGEVTGDVVTVGPDSIFPIEQGTLMIDFYVDEYFGIASTGNDRYIRTIVDVAETETENRIRFYKNTPSHSYGVEVRNQFGQIFSTTFSLTLPIGWHRVQLNYDQLSVSAIINGSLSATLSYTGERSAGGVINIGSNRFNTWENYGGYLKNLYVFDAIQSAIISSDSQTRYSTYKSSESVTIVDQIGGEALKNPAMYWNNTSGATKTVTGGIADPVGGFNAYRVRILGGTATTKQTYITQKFGTLRQSVTYSSNCWFRMISTTGATTIISLNGAAVINPHNQFNWTNFQSSPSPIGVGQQVGTVSQFIVQSSDTTTGSVLEFEIYNPEFTIQYTRSRDTFTPNNEIDIPISTSSLRFKHRLGSEYNYGIVGAWESEVLDTGATRPNAKYIAKEIVDSIPSGSSVSYEFAASDSQSGPFTFTSSLSQISGRYVKAKATIYANNVADGYPTITSVKLIPESKSS